MTCSGWASVMGREFRGRQSRWVRVSELASRGGVLLGRGRGPRRDDEWCLVIPSSWEPALMSSSTTNALSRQPLVQVLRNITDPRDRRGARHSLFTVLSLAVTGVLAGCCNLTAIWEHATDLTGADLEALGLEKGQTLPSESTIRRVLQDLDHATGAVLTQQRVADKSNQRSRP